MARTAPVPNIPAIPGMNPGIFVMGGGGAGGGGSGKSGRGSGQGQGADGQNGGDGATGGGEGAGACGEGTSSCPGPHGAGGGTAAGDPVDVASGHVFIPPQFDLSLPGPLPLRVSRSYNSGAFDRDIGLGPGWYHCFEWTIHIRRRTTVVHNATGDRQQLALVPEVGQPVPLPGRSFLVRTVDGFELVGADDITLVFKPDPLEPQRFLLASLMDRNGNRVSVARDLRGRIHALIDSVGRRLRVRWNHRNHIEAFEVKNAATRGQWVGFYRYEYDSKDRLIAVVGALGDRETFTYDDDDLLTTHTRAAGMTTFYRYDAQRRCVETWAQGPEGNACLSEDVPSLLGDGKTRARGFLHCCFFRDGDYVEVIDSTEVRRHEANAHGLMAMATLGGAVFTRAFDERGNMNSYTDPLGNTTAFRRDENGGIIGIIDPLGRSTWFDYDDRGNHVQTSYADGSHVTTRYDGHGNVLGFDDALGMYQEYRRDSRGLLTEVCFGNGAKAQMTYDGHGNRVAVVEPDGSTKTIEYDFLGRVTRFTDPAGHHTSYNYDALGRLTRATLPDGSNLSFAYDADGRLTQRTNAAGATITYRWGGLDVVHEMVREDGRVVRYRYDREMRLVEIWDHGGVQHKLIRDISGLVVAEETFDGRRMELKYDLAGQLVTADLGGGEKINLEWDEAGQLVAREFPDGTRHAYEYDDVGRLRRATTPETEVVFERDPRGRVVREIQRRLDLGTEHWIRHSYDAFDATTERCSSLGLHQRMDRDLVGRLRRLELDGEVVDFSYDERGLETRRALPQGGVVTTTHDGNRMLVEREIESRSGRRLRRYTYAESRELRRLSDSQSGETAFEHDPTGRIVEIARPGQPVERYGYDSAADLYEAGLRARQREYAPGGRPGKLGETGLTYDETGRVIARGTDADATRYDWQGAHNLARVTKPSGERADYVYDALMRKVGRVVRDAQGRVVSASAFVWDGTHLLHEHRIDSNDEGESESCTTWILHDESMEPVAERSGRDGVTEGWRFHVPSPTGGADLLLDATGAVVDDPERTAFGLTESASALRMLGQSWDDFSGLCYHHFRHYDSDSGHYLTPDPVGVSATLHTYAYVAYRPTTLVDPHGLAPTTVTLMGGGQPIQTGHSTAHYRNNDGAHQSNGPASLPGNHPHPGNCFQGPNDCGEVDAINRHLANGGSLDDIDEIRINNKGNYLKPCGYCTQRLARMSLENGTNLFHRVRGPNGERCTPLATNPRPDQWYHGQNGERQFPDPRQPFQVDPNTGSISDRNGNLLMA